MFKKLKSLIFPKKISTKKCKKCIFIAFRINSLSYEGGYPQQYECIRNKNKSIYVSDIHVNVDCEFYIEGDGFRDCFGCENHQYYLPCSYVDSCDNYDKWVKKIKT